MAENDKPALYPDWYYTAFHCLHNYLSSIPISDCCLLLDKQTQAERSPFPRYLPRHDHLATCPGSCRMM
ncbi:Uncharacterised protein [Segatella copri]|nr:Uncharacterised protein [Segatella copri]